MTGRIFGTDGIRGRANVYPIVAETMVSLAKAAGRRFAHVDRRSRVVIGKDTRLSGYMIESALVAGFTSVGMDVVLTGPVPTPAVGMLTRSLRADLGIMISASHNPYCDNGIKFFGPDGCKISSEDQAAIEADLAHDGPGVDADRIGNAKRIDGAAERYVEFVKQTFPRGLRLAGLKIVVDAANGAAFKVAPQLIWELGAEVISIGCEPNGLNINDKCGSTSPEYCQAKVIEHGADIGITLDGDADRVILVDEQGQLVDGDQLTALIAMRAMRAGRLKGSAVVATIMSNLGLEHHLAENGLRLERTQVGDRFVFARMREIGANVGGEQSGHIIMSDYATTGDGLLAGLQALAEIAETQVPASRALKRFDPVPQVLRNVRIRKGETPLDSRMVREAISAARSALGAAGRIVIRPSGTEPVIRIMAEGEDQDVVTRIADALGQLIATGSRVPEKKVKVPAARVAAARGTARHPADLARGAGFSGE